ncbi:CvfD/Ygs/GSP13 family RNA-binding post-transcriptional regulator [Effusibacillus dendaii]|uniref:General stress protein 13 n=1 Tax=Effusibacillus dendaii TaxID=2743772 RepID=A0A7I8DEA1_9BACL|nr:CvfD/Ygs/GSP13 family RNA-binding post-transcriptional regulator [Effusibacillus dendaii]BCJ86860.1 general stress protein 13 [Effusibacillus dendaii]
MSTTSVEVGSIIEGKVTSIKPFGAFVAINESQQGLVHISQIAHSFVKEVSDHLSVGDTVQVKVMSIDPETGKVSLSIKEAMPKPETTTERRQPRENRRREGGNFGGGRNERSNVNRNDSRERFNTFEDQLKKWLKHSEENLATLNKKNNR